MAALGPLLLPLFVSTAAGVAVQAITKPKLQPFPAIQPLPEVPGRGTSSEIAKAAEQERRRRLGATGRAATVLGGQVGAPLQQKTLLGE